MKSRKRCLLVALWLTLPIAISLQMTSAFTSQAVLSRCGVLTAALNLPGFLLVYLAAYQMDVPVLSLIAVGDTLFWIPAIYALLRWGEWVRLRRRTYAARGTQAASMQTTRQAAKRRKSVQSRAEGEECGRRQGFCGRW